MMLGPFCAKQRAFSPGLTGAAKRPLVNCTLFLLQPALAQPADNRQLSAFWGGAALGITIALVFLAILVVCIVRLRVARQEFARANELADVRERERDLAQQELVQRLEQERELVKEKLQFDSQLSDFEKYASLSQLALGTAHEINNPLLGIMSHLELELKDADSEQRAEIEQCLQGVRRISSAIHGLMDYARPGPLALSRVNLHRLTAQAFEFLAPQPLFSQLQLNNCIPIDIPEIVADGNQITQILTNLLLNAAQATPPGGSITVMAETSKSGEIVELRVRDTGRGIPADILPHIFEPFFTTKRGTGTGLGLSISRNYACRHGGDIQLQSIPGSGTTVRVILPVRQSVKAAPQPDEVIV
jgi:signal transduction histidine kinase